MFTKIPEAEAYALHWRFQNLTRRRDSEHYLFLCMNCGEAKTYNKIMNGSMCVDGPSHRHTCGQQEKHTQRFEVLNMHAAWRMLIRIMVNVLIIFIAKGQVCFATVFEEVEASAKQH